MVGHGRRDRPVCSPPDGQVTHGGLKLTLAMNVTQVLALQCVAFWKGAGGGPSAGVGCVQLLSSHLYLVRRPQVQVPGYVPRSQDERKAR